MATFSLSDTSRRAQATGNGSNVTFAFSFQVNATSDVKVYVGDTLKTLSTHYTIVDSSNDAGLNSNGTGTVKFITSPTDYTPANGDIVTILSDVPVARTSVYTSGGNITAAALESDFDTQAMMLGDREERETRTVMAPVNDPTNVDMTLPAKADRLGKVLGFNSSTGNPEAVDATPSNSEIRAAVEAASDSNVFTDADHSKLNAIEAAATADQTASQIKTAYESNSDTNAFTDADHSKLDGIATSANNYSHPNHSGEVTSTSDGATVISDNVVDEANLKVSNSPTNGYVLTAQSGNTGGLTWAAASDGGGENNQNAFSNVAVSGQSTVEADSVTDTLTLAAGSNVTLTTDSSTDTVTIAATDTNTTYSVGDGGLSEKNFTTALNTKLSGIEASADVTDTTNVVASLTAGTNVSIANDGTISSTDTNTTYSDATTSSSGLMSSSDKTKIDGIETGATADQTSSEIKTAYEANSDTNAFTDAEQTKLSGIETGATADLTAAEIKTLYESNNLTNAFDDSFKSKLTALYQPTDSQIKTAYENNSDTNAFTDAEKTKLTSVDTDSEENQNAYARVNIWDSSGTLQNATIALNKSEPLILQEGSGINIDKISTQQIRISTATGELYKANESSPSAQPSATGANAIALGDSAIASGDQSVAFNNSRASAMTAIAMGNITTNSSAGALKANATAIGRLAKADYLYSTALGYGAIPNANYQIALGDSNGNVKISGAYTLPNGAGSSGQVLTTAGDGTTSWAAASGGGGGDPDLYRDNASSATTPTVAGTNAVAIGSGAVAATNQSIALGLNATVGTSTRGTALGYSANATGSQATAISDSTASGGNSFSAVADATASGTDSIAIGRAATASSAYATAIGKNSSDQGSVATSGTAAMALGGSRASGADSFAAAIGTNSSSYGASGASSIAMGEDAKATNAYAFSLGYLTTASGISSAVFGAVGSTASGTRSLIVGGQGQTASGDYSAVLGGQGNTASGEHSAVIGESSTASHTNSVSIGDSVQSTAANQINLGGTADTVRISESYTLPTSDGSANYVLTTNGSGVASWAAASGGGGGADLYAANESSPSAQPSATGANAVALGDSAVASDEDAFAGPMSRASGTHSVALGVANGSSTYGASGSYSISIGYQSRAKAGQSVALGSTAYVDSDSLRGLSLGENAYVEQMDYGSAIGANARVHGSNSATHAVALGTSRAAGSHSFAAGISSNSSSYGAQSNNGIAMGMQAKAHDSQYSVAIGRNNISSGGSGCTVIGGQNNEATATSSIITGGANCSITGSAQYARAGGGYSKAAVHGKDVFASGQFSSVGDAQGAKYILRADTTDATATVLTTSNGNPANWNQIVAASDTCITFDGTITAMQNGAQAYASWRIEGLLVNDGGTTTLANSATTVIQNASSWGMALSADNTNNALAITCTGEASHNIRWVANIRTSEVTYA